MKNSEVMALHLNLLLETGYDICLKVDEYNDSGKNVDVLCIEHFEIVKGPHVVNTILGETTLPGYEIYVTDPEGDSLFCTTSNLEMALQRAFTELMIFDIKEHVRTNLDEVIADTQKHTYKFVSYDVWGNDADGYEVNDAHYTGDMIVLKQGIPDKVIISKCTEMGWVNPELNVGDIEIEGEEGHTLYFMYTPTCYPMFELRCEEDV